MASYAQAAELALSRWPKLQGPGAIRQSVLLPMLASMGYDIYDPDDLQIDTKIGQTPVEIAIFHQNTPVWCFLAAPTPAALEELTTHHVSYVTWLEQKNWHTKNLHTANSIRFALEDVAYERVCVAQWEKFLKDHLSQHLCFTSSVSDRMVQFLQAPEIDDLQKLFPNQPFTNETHELLQAQWPQMLAKALTHVLTSSSKNLAKEKDGAPKSDTPEEDLPVSKEEQFLMDLKTKMHARTQDPDLRPAIDALQSHKITKGEVIFWQRERAGAILRVRRRTDETLPPTYLLENDRAVQGDIDDIIPDLLQALHARISPTDTETPSRKALKLLEIGLEVGTVLQHREYPHIIAHVQDDKKVILNDLSLTLAEADQKVKEQQDAPLLEMRRGAEWWMYEGETLRQRHSRLRSV